MAKSFLELKPINSVKRKVILYVYSDCRTEFRFYEEGTLVRTVRMDAQFWNNVPRGLLWKKLLYEVASWAAPNEVTIVNVEVDYPSNGQWDLTKE